jgi:hypothetical protein
MPRKTFGLPFEVYPSPMKNGEGRNLLYVRPMQGRTMTLDELDDYCARNTGLARYELTNAINHFASAARYFLADGKRIETPIGSFAPRLGLKREITDPADVDVRDVELRGIEFLPSKSFLQEIERMTGGFLHAPNCRRDDAMPTDAQLRKALDNDMATHNGRATVSSFRFETGLTRYSAQKYLDSLCSGDRPVLRREQIGRSFVYVKAE